MKLHTKFGNPQVNSDVIFRKLMINETIYEKYSRYIINLSIIIYRDSKTFLKIGRCNQTGISAEAWLHCRCSSPK
jgi:hypothetical protein